MAVWKSKEKYFFLGITNFERLQLWFYLTYYEVPK